MVRLVTLLLLTCAWVFTAQAQLRDERLTRQLLQELSPLQSGAAARELSAAEAARIAQSQYGGRVLSVDPAGNGYRVKLLIAGEVRIVHINER